MLQAADKLLDRAGRLVEGAGQHADLAAGPDVGAPREVPGAERGGVGGELADRRGDPLGDQPGQQQRERQHHAPDHQVADEVGACRDQRDLGRRVHVDDPGGPIGDGVPDDPVVGRGRLTHRLGTWRRLAAGVAAERGKSGCALGRDPRQEWTAHVDDRDGGAAREASDVGQRRHPVRPKRQDQDDRRAGLIGQRTRDQNGAGPVGRYLERLPDDEAAASLGVRDLVLQRRSRDPRAEIVAPGAAELLAGDGERGDPIDVGRQIK